MQYDYVLKKLNFDLLAPSPRLVGEEGGGGVCRQNICYHVSAFRYSRLFDMQHDHVLKKLSFDLWTILEGGGRGVYW